LDLKRLLKRGALVAAANWQTVAIQFLAQTTFQVLLAVPIAGAALMVAVLLGRDLAYLVRGTVREMFASVADALTAEPVAFLAFIIALSVVLLGGSVLMFLVKGGTMAIFVDANAHTGPIEAEPVTYESLKAGARFTMPAFLDGCVRSFRPYLSLGLLLMLVYSLTGIGYLVFVLYGYRLAADHEVLIVWTFVAAISTVLLVLWITVINLAYLLLQMVIAAEGHGVADAARVVWIFVRQRTRSLGGIFVVVLGIVVGATLVSALAWSGVGLIAFVPLVGLAVFPLQIAALVIRGLVFEYIGLTALGAYVTLYRQHALARAAESREPLQSIVPSIT
jgi:hypothetical protein